MGVDHAVVYDSSVPHHPNSSPLNYDAELSQLGYELSQVNTTELKSRLSHMYFTCRGTQ
jgi:hypothetical protein